MRIAPTSIRLEASSHCQLRCPSCPTTTGAIDAAIGKGFLKASDFRALINANPALRRVELSNYGEVFLNPELLEIFAHAHARGVSLSIDNGANLNVLRPEVADGLVKYAVRRIGCSIDGATPETYEKYRVRGSLEKVLGNIRTINDLKSRYGSDLPELRWQFILFEHNRHELDAARALAESLDMEFSVKLSWDDSPGNDGGMRSLTRIMTRADFRERYGREYMEGLCEQLWLEPQINWDGKLLGCCRNFWGDFGGNAFHDGLMECVNGEKMMYARDMLRGKRPPRDDIPCTTCEIYHSRREGGRFIEVR